MLNYCQTEMENKPSHISEEKMKHYLHLRKSTSVAILVGVLLSSMVLVGCSPPGLLYTDVKGPLAATSNEGASKVGSSSATSILGLVATGDASIDAAAKAGGITKIHHVDFQMKSILFFYMKATVTVYGE